MLSLKNSSLMEACINNFFMILIYIHNFVQVAQVRSYVNRIFQKVLCLANKFAMLDIEIRIFVQGSNSS
jgi:hypothetical protein